MRTHHFGHDEGHEPYIQEENEAAIPAYGDESNEEFGQGFEMDHGMTDRDPEFDGDEIQMNEQL